MILSFLSKDAEDSPQSNSKKGNSVSSGQRGGDHTQLLQETATDSRRCWYVCMFSLSLSLPITYAHEQNKKIWASFLELVFIMLTVKQKLPLCDNEMHFAIFNILL